MTSDHDQLSAAFERLAQAAKECLDTYERVCLQRPAEPAADHHARLAAEPAKCPNCPPGYDCETGNYSYDDFAAIRDEQAARRAEVFPVSRALFDEDPAAYDPHGTGARLAAGTEQ